MAALLSEAFSDYSTLVALLAASPRRRGGRGSKCHDQLLEEAQTGRRVFRTANSMRKLLVTITVRKTRG